MSTFSLTTDHEYDAPASEVFDGFLDLYAEPRPDWIVESALDLRVGGTWDVTFRPPGLVEFQEHRVITTVDRPRCLAYDATISGHGEPFTTGVTLTIEDAESSRSRLTLTQSGFPDAATRDDFAGGWPGVLSLLEHLPAS